jgi:hypothetical protein
VLIWIGTVTVRLGTGMMRMQLAMSWPVALAPDVVAPFPRIFRMS